MNLKRSLAAPALAFSLCFTAAACGGGDNAAVAPTPTPTATETECPPSGTALTLLAEDIEFDKICLVAPANQPITITMDNKDAGIPHNFAIYPDLRSTAALFKGENVSGPVVKTYNVPALAAGEYHFRCDIHPKQMQGDFVNSADPSYRPLLALRHEPRQLPTGDDHLVDLVRAVGDA